MTSPHPESNRLHVPTGVPSSLPAKNLPAITSIKASVKKIVNLAVDGCYGPLLCSRLRIYAIVDTRRQDGR